MWKGRCQAALQAADLHFVKDVEADVKKALQQAGLQSLSAVVEERLTTSSISESRADNVTETLDAFVQSP
eukprot:1374595-Heterocapsa_arctica.AAC.1